MKLSDCEVLSCYDPCHCGVSMRLYFYHRVQASCLAYVISYPIGTRNEATIAWSCLVPRLRGSSLHTSSWCGALARDHFKFTFVLKMSPCSISGQLLGMSIEVINEPNLFNIIYLHVFKYVTSSFTIVMHYCLTQFLILIM